MTLQPRDLMPMFTVIALDGRRVAYADVWQRRNLLLVVIPNDEATADQYVTALRARASAITGDDVELIVTGDAIQGIPSPGVVVADRWGEIFYVAGASRASELPGPDELFEWLQYVQKQCPECQGEAR